MNGLREELARVGIRGRLASRIVDEIDDHLACDPAAAIGAPSLIADRFAEELRRPLTRRATHLAFAGLAVAAILLAVATSGTPVDLGGVAGATVSVSGLFLVLAAQVAFVAGVLAVWGLHRGTPLAVVQRRVAAALGAGIVIFAAEAVDAVALKHWLLLAAVAPLPVLAASARQVRLAGGMTPADVDRVRGFTNLEASALGVAVVAAMVVGSAFAEHSWVEGVTRGAFEAVAFAAGYLLLGRRLGIRGRT